MVPHAPPPQPQQLGQGNRGGGGSPAQYQQQQQQQRGAAPVNALTQQLKSSLQVSAPGPAAAPQRPGSAAPAPQRHAPAAASPAPAAPESVDGSDADGKMSASQRKRMRKKLREGKK
jgi:hypothetical protein